MENGIIDLISQKKKKFARFFLISKKDKFARAARFLFERRPNKEIIEFACFDSKLQ